MTNSPKSQPSAAIADSLEQQATAMEELRACLEEEYRALQMRDPEQILTITEQKHACISEATRTEQRCRELGVDDCNERAIVKKRSNIDTLIRTCRDLNDANGALIRKQKSRVEGTLRILRGEPEETANTYGPRGTNAAATLSRKFLASV
ncbi:MAG: flagellar protein FlgN [Gammaproteobacteria bacterium]|nr:flagellar protein FlgN [Gammaproteobacteria bacterium]